jgi:hypothetical protein
VCVAAQGITFWRHDNVTVELANAWEEVRRTAADNYTHDQDPLNDMLKQVTGRRRGGAA